eukprot:CAMPEP_0198326354 /NCGR_PEP_ID=MMETSP1450-20131203/13906_1 /TAXON_ID=753684 ORGANISM="Madagascaria erythrocladiodes, Strain CCMP3234" /NCGR_SAMPLE_ID=MMETSP1450 /ASSEMBLY_ACC=CAM_ASM_001115 /LENGTH=271 /DNA_ID=CAMNT_0044030315 /DNA_START=176 /DNA_END=991 /DNA_ORIENTATION=-
MEEAPTTSDERVEPQPSRESLESSGSSGDVSVKKQRSVRVQEPNCQPSPRRKRLIMGMMAVVAISGVTSVVLAVLTIVLSRSSKSSSALVVGLETLVGVIGGFFVVARFAHEYKGGTNDERLSEYERVGARAESALFIAFALVALVDAVTQLLAREKTRTSNAIIVVLFISAVQGLIQAVTEVILARRLESLLGQEDAVGALTGSLMSLAAGVTAVVVRTNPNLWWIDQILGMAFAVMLLCFGIYFACAASHYHPPMRTPVGSPFNPLLRV